jgi:hypothetical protein
MSSATSVLYTRVVAQVLKKAANYPVWEVGHGLAIDRGIVGHYIDNIVKLLFRMPGTIEIYVPFWWKSQTKFGRLRNAVYTRANADPMISLLDAV